MFSVAPLLMALTLLALSITGSPVEVRNSLITLPMTRRPSFSNITELLQHDEARMAAFSNYSTHDRRDGHVPIISDNWCYTVAVGIGVPPTFYNLLVDTGTSVTWVGARTPYVRTRTGVDTEERVAVNYIGGSFEGTIFEDTITFNDGLTIPDMSIGVATQHRDIRWDGILGIGPERLSLGALTDTPWLTIPTITNYLYTQRTISEAVVGIFFKPTIRNIVNYGELSFGRPDPAMYTGEIEYTATTLKYPASQFWGINQRITYGSTDILRYTAGTIDTGTTFLYIASDAYERYKAVTGAQVSRVNGLLQITPAQYNALHDLSFGIDWETYRLIPNAQIWPRSLNNKVHGADNDIYLVVKPLRTPTGVGDYDFINGYVFLQRFYTVLDAQTSRVGFAETLFTYHQSN